MSVRILSIVTVLSVVYSLSTIGTIMAFDMNNNNVNNLRWLDKKEINE